MHSEREFDQKMTSLYFAPTRKYGCRIASTLTSGMPQIAASTARRSKRFGFASGHDIRLLGECPLWVEAV
jgi:hypothetical protein